MGINLFYEEIHMIKLRRNLFIVCGAISLFYYLVCLAYAGIRLSFVWIWLLFGGFCFIRAHMLTRKMQGRTRIHPPKWLVWAYRIGVTAAVVLFVMVESQVVASMNAQPKDNLDYVIVLGAGMRGTTPTRPLLLRIQRAYDYMMENPGTMLIASGGQGANEDISEAQCIRDTLVQMGLDENRILLEDKSRDTIQNIRNSYELIEDKNSEVGIITNGFHIWRSVSIAQSQGHENVSGVPAKTLMPVGIHYTVREFFGYVKWKFL